MLILWKKVSNFPKNQNLKIPYLTRGLLIIIYKNLLNVKVSMRLASSSCENSLSKDEREFG